MASRQRSRKSSVFSRFRLAAAILMIAVGLGGAIFYGLVSSHYTGLMMGRTLGPYTDALAQFGFEDPEGQLWPRMARRHGVAILIEAPGEEPVAWDERGESISPEVLEELDPPIRGTRAHTDGTRATFFWNTRAFQGSHLPILGGLLLVIVAVVGTAFWFLHRQLRPLAALQDGVDALAQGDFDVRVPVARDDEIGRAAEAFNDMAARVGEMVEDRERLLGDVSHELRSPIARMKVALELMPKGDKRDSIGRDLKEMEELIAVLLEREALRSRTGRFEGESVDLEAVAAEVAAVFADQGPGVELDSAGEATIVADPALMKLLLQNLVDNALKFSHPDSRPVVVRLERQGARVVVRVIDDGIGIPRGSEERVFEPFTKADRARGHRSGHGLGLNLCQRVVELHGGSIRLESRDPRGTEAVVELG